MSGGSYDYLCLQGADELVGSSHHQANIDAMAARLSGLGYAQDAARETEELLLILRQVETRLDVRIGRLNGIWRAVEWWDSGDSGEDGVKEALKQYREKGMDI